MTTSLVSASPDSARPSPPGLTDLGGLGPRAVVRLGLEVTPSLKSGLLFTALLALVAGAGRIIAPLTVQHALDRQLAPRAVLEAVSVGAVATVLAGTGSWLLHRRVQQRIEQGLAQLRRLGLRRVHDMSAATADQARSADLVSRLTNDVDAVTTFMQGGGVQTLTNLAQLLLAAIVLTIYSWQLALPVLVLAVLLFLAMTRVQRVIARRFDQVRVDLSSLQSVITEAVIGAPVIRSTGTAERMRARLDASVDDALGSQVRTLTPLHANTSLGELAISTMTVTIVMGGTWWATWGVPAGDPAHLSAGKLVAMIFLVTFFVRPLQFLVQSLGEVQNAFVGWRRALELAATPSAVVHAGRALPPGPLGVELVGVSASYGGGPVVLRDLTVSIAPGEHVAVVGHTGSGKSTFTKLLTRRLVPLDGELRVGGVPLQLVADSALERRLVVVPQDPFLFDTTIEENIAIAAPGQHHDAVREVITALGLEPWLAGLPDGLDTQVGLRGDRLSAGERQLVALARTALVDPDLIVLDEATSGLDPATDVRMQTALAALTQGRTTVSIAHRMVTAESADRVLVFEEGRVVQAGHHRDLVGVDGPYARLSSAWTRRSGPARRGVDDL